MTRRNRVDPWGDLHAVPERGMFTGNRGILVDADGDVVRHHRGRLWITCVTEFRGRRHPLDSSRTWTPLFFLDDAVALAAGHRPCGECRRADYMAYRDAVSASLGACRPLRASELDARLADERLRRGRGLSRAGDRRLWTARVGELPTGTVVADARRQPHLVDGPALRPFSFAGWSAASRLDADTLVDVLTPPTSVAALRNGFRPHISGASNVDEAWT